MIMILIYGNKVEIGSIYKWYVNRVEIGCINNR